MTAMNGYLAELIGGLVLMVAGALSGIVAFVAWPFLVKFATPLLLHVMDSDQAHSSLSILVLFVFGFAGALAASAAWKVLHLPLNHFRPPGMVVFLLVGIPVFGATVGLMYLVGARVSVALQPFFGQSADSATNITFGIFLIAALRVTLGMLQRCFGI